MHATRDPSLLFGWLCAGNRRFGGVSTSLTALLLATVPKLSARVARLSGIFSESGQHGPRDGTLSQQGRRSSSSSGKQAQPEPRRAPAAGCRRYRSPTSARVGRPEPQKADSRAEASIGATMPRREDRFVPVASGRTRPARATPSPQSRHSNDCRTRTAATRPAPTRTI